MGQAIQSVPVGDCRPSSTNPRRRIDPARLEELTASVRERVAKLLRERGIVMLTAESDGGSLRAEVYGETSRPADGTPPTEGGD